MKRYNKTRQDTKSKKLGRCNYMNLKQRAAQLKSDLPAVFLSLKDKQTPLIVKILAGLTVAYALSPMDLIPDFIPVLGYLDDLIILPALVALTVKFIPIEVFEQNREKAKDIWAEGKPKKWYYALPILLVWGILFAFILKLIFDS